MLFIVFGGFALVSLAGGRDPLGEASTPIFVVLLVAWFISDRVPWVAPRMAW